MCHICRCTSLLAILLTWSFHFEVWMKYFLDKNQIKILYLIAYSLLSYLLAFLLHFPNDQSKNKVILEKQRRGCKCVPQISLSQQTTLSLKSSRKSKVICLVIRQATTVSCLATLLHTIYLLYFAATDLLVMSFKTDLSTIICRSEKRTVKIINVTLMPSPRYSGI